MSNRSSIVSFALLAPIAALAVACASTAPCTKDGGSVASDKGGGAGATTAASGPVEGDADIVALAKKTLACKSSEGCKEPEEWSWTAETWEGGAGDASLVSLVSDSDPKMRALAADQLHSLYFGKHIPKRKRGYPANATLGAKIIEAFTTEQNEDAARALGRSMACINFHATGLEDKAWAAFKSAKLAEARVSFLEELGRQYREEPAMVEKIEGTLGDADAKVRVAALDALDTGDPDQGVCGFWQKNLANADEKVSEKAIELLARRKCAGVSKVLDALEKKAKLSSYELEAVCEREDVEAKDKTRAANIAKTRANDGKADAWDRANALEAYMKCDADGGKKLAESWANGSDKDLQERAKSILSGG